MHARPLPFLVAFCAFLACTDLPTIEPNACGNGVIEAGEDCDTFANAGADTHCRSPGQPGACRYDCDTAKCPKGWGCGADHVCREPTARFGESINGFATVADRLRTADIDGDGRADILTLSKPDPLGRTNARVFFFDDPKQPPAVSTVLHAPAAGPVLGDLNQDGRADLAFSSLSGLNVLLGQRERKLSPQAFSRFPLPPGAKARMTIVTGTKSPSGDAPMLFLEMTGMKFVAVATEGTELKDATIAPLEQGPDKLVGDPVAVNLVEASKCDELVFAFQGATEVTMISPCDALGAFKKTDTVSKPLRVSNPIKSVLTGDLDTDGHVDLIVGTDSGVLIAFGRGDGTFNSAADGTGTVGGATPLKCTVVRAVGPSTPCGVPLAVSPPKKTVDDPYGHLVALPNDVMHLTGFKASKTEIEIIGDSMAQRLAGAWTAARIADFNGNGILDVALGSSSGLDIDFFNGTPSGALNPSKIPTNFPVGLFAVADLDGDLVADLAFTELGAGGAGQDTLYVAYGKTAGAPEEPLTLGTFPNIRQIFPALFEGRDAISELGLAYTSADGDRMTVLTGNGDRQLLSPFGLISGNATASVQGGPFSLALGQFDDNPAIDLAALGFDNGPNLPVAPLRFWFVPIAGDAKLTSSTYSDAIPKVMIRARASEAFAISPIIRAGDLDGDKIDEAIALMPTGILDKDVPAPSTTVVIARSEKTKDGFVFKLATSLVLPQPAYGPGPGSELAVADIDGDGARDLVVLVRIADDKSSFFVLWNDGKGGFDPSRVSNLAPKDGKPIVDFCLVQADVDAQMEIAAISSTSGFFVNAKQGQARALELESIPPIAGGSAIASGDVTGDGVVDLVVGSGPTVSFFPGVPRLP